MSNVIDHYETLLAEHYSWMFGVAPPAKAAEQLALLSRLQLTPGELAVDLGAASGFQSMALADLGFERVLAIDTSARLLRKLRSNCGNRPVTPIEDDMLRILQHVTPGSADAVVCMGDTLTHLPRRELVHTREDGSWKFAKNCYPKLRLAVDEVSHELVQTGFDVYAVENVRGMSILGAQKG
jgi:SAM-dependent methyltransferase